MNRPFKDANGNQVKTTLANFTTINFEQLFAANDTENWSIYNGTLISCSERLFNFDSTSIYSGIISKSKFTFTAGDVLLLLCYYGTNISSYYALISKDGNKVTMTENGYGFSLITAAASTNNAIIYGNFNKAQNCIIGKVQLFNLTTMGLADKITEASQFVKLFGYADIASMPYFSPSLNGTYIAYEGKLYKYEE